MTARVYNYTASFVLLDPNDFRQWFGKTRQAYSNFNYAKEQASRPIADGDDHEEEGEE